MDNEPAPETSNMVNKADDGLRQISGQEERHWSLGQLFGGYDPLPGEDPKDRIHWLRTLAPEAEMEYDSLPETARLGCNFWKQIRPERMETYSHEYTVRIADTYHWKVELNGEGLRYTDISGLYGEPGQVTFQLLSDFWFYGPAAPLPTTDVKKILIARIRAAFIQVGGAAYDRPFSIFEYPDPNTPSMPYWNSGDPLDGTYVIVRNFGLEYGRHHFREGLIQRVFLSFEQVMERGDLCGPILTPDILEQVRTFIRMFANGGRSLLQMEQSGKHPVIAREERSRQLFMENGGVVHQIYRDGMGDEYSATAAQEEEWRAELQEKYLDRIAREDDATVLRSLVKSLVQWGTPDLEERLVNAAGQAPAKQRQSIATVLWELFRSEHAFDLLLVLREEEPASYWKNYVTSTFGRMFDCSRLRRWVLTGLHSDLENRFSYAADIVRLWALRTENGPIRIDHLIHLSWQEKQAGNPETLEVLRELDSILG